MRVLAVDAKTVIENEPPLAVGHEGAAEDLAIRKEEDCHSGDSHPLAAGDGERLERRACCHSTNLTLSRKDGPQGS